MSNGIMWREDGQGRLYVTVQARRYVWDASLHIPLYVAKKSKRSHYLLPRLALGHCMECPSCGRPLPLAEGTTECPLCHSRYQVQQMARNIRVHVERRRALWR